MKKPLERPRAGPILPRSDWSVLPSCAERWDGGEDRNTSLPGFDSPTDAVQENGTYGDEGKAVGFPILPGGLLAKPLASPRRLCCLSSRSIQDQQNQTRDQHNGHHPRHREY